MACSCAYYRNVPLIYLHALHERLANHTACPAGRCDFLKLKARGEPVSINDPANNLAEHSNQPVAGAILTAGPIGSLYAV